MPNTRARLPDRSFPHLRPRDPADARLREVRRRILLAARRGFGETAIEVAGAPGDFDPIRDALDAEGYGVASVTGEDGPYMVVFW